MASCSLANAAEFCVPANGSVEVIVAVLLYLLVPWSRVFPFVSCAVRLKPNAVPAVEVPGSELTENWLKVPGSTVMSCEQAVHPAPTVVLAEPPAKVQTELAAYSEPVEGPRVDVQVPPEPAPTAVMVQVGVVVYPRPLLVMVKAVTTPPDTVAVHVALVPPVGAAVRAQLAPLVYPLPAAEMLSEPTA